MKLTTAHNAYGNVITTGTVSIAGSIFCVASQNPFVNPVVGDNTPQYPEDGAINVPVDVTFTWQAVAGATGYQFAIAQDNPDLTNKFAVLDYSANTITNAHKVQETLLPDTTYWWEVRSVAGNVYSAWTIQTFFTTAKAPVVTSTTTTAPPVTIVQTSIVVTQPPATTTYHYQFCGKNATHSFLPALGCHRSWCRTGHRRYRPDCQNSPHALIVPI